MGRIGISCFSSRGRSARQQMFLEDYSEDLFEATKPSNQDLKNQQPQQQQHQDAWSAEGWPDIVTNQNHEETEEKANEEEDKNEQGTSNLNIVASTLSGGDVFDGLSLNPSSSSAAGTQGADEPDSECQAREDIDVGDDDNVVIHNNKNVSDTNEGDHNNNDEDRKKRSRDAYKDVREEFLSDDDTTSMSSGYTSADTSTLSSLNPKPAQTSDAFCHDDLQIAKTLLQFGEKGAESVDEINRFLYSELEVGGFVEDVEEFRQDLMRNGMQKLSQIEWSELLKFSLYNQGNGSVGQKKPTLPASDTSTLVTEPQGESVSTATGPREPKALAVVPVNQTTAVFVAAATASEAAASDATNATAEADKTTTGNSDPLAGCLSGLNDMTLEEKKEEEQGEDFEGFEMPFPSWEESISKEEEVSDEKRGSKKRNSFLSKLRYPNPTKRGRVASAPVPKTPKILRVKLKDGSMASVSVDTVERLQACHWV